MCEFCTRHGEGEKWYLRMENYSEEVFRAVSSPLRLKAYLEDFSRTLRQGPALAHAIRRRIPRIYDFLIRPSITRRLKKAHFGQILPIEDIARILAHFPRVVRLPCVCRKVSTGRELWYCFGVGMDLTPIYREVPDFRDLGHVSSADALALMRSFEDSGMVHSVWTLGTPFIGAICNCDRDCMAYRTQIEMGVAKTMWKAEYVAAIDPGLCTGCGECGARCQYGAVRYDAGDEKCSVDARECYGCGICRTACGHGAIALLERYAVPEAAGLW